MATERITLVGGPADGEQFDWPGGDLLKWVPADEREIVTARMHERDDYHHRPILYRRSLRSRHRFVYQP